MVVGREIEDHCAQQSPTVQYETYMKRYGNLKEKILSDENLQLAEKKARKGKGNTYGVKRYDRRPELSLELIKKQLDDGSYRTSPYYGWLAHCDGRHLLKLTIPDLYGMFKKRYIKQHGVHILKH